MQVAKNKVVAIDYTLKDPKGELLDQSRPGQPLAYIHGNGGLIPGLEKALDGKTAGDAVLAVIEPEQAYGIRRDEFIEAVPRDSFRGVPNIEKGMQFEARTPQGPRVVTVVDVAPDTVTVDANHPLAGVTLHFDVKVVEVREANAEEIAHGHVHGPGGHQH